MLKVILWFILGAVTILAASFVLRDVSEFASNFGLNLAAGFLGAAVSLALGVVLARQLALKRVEALGRPIAYFVRQMRLAGKFSPDGARAAVVVAVKLLSEGGLGKERDTTGKSAEVLCPVCDLPYRVKRLATGEQSCEECGLRGSAWCQPPVAEQSVPGSS
jgi:ribosomal protein L37AE/L43A